jgi:hypothetical protein
VTCRDRETEIQTGSNGFGSGQATSGNSMYINCTILEVQVHSDEGLTFMEQLHGTIFIYQGFNDYCGWMHTSSNVM